MTISGGSITGQAAIDSHVSTWVELCLAIVNDLAIEVRQGRRVPADAGLADAFARLAADPLTRDFEVSSADVDDLASAARRLHIAIDTCIAGDLLTAAFALNTVLAEFGAVPNLHAAAGEVPHLTFHAADAPIVDAWAAESATALAFLVGTQQTHRLGQCGADSCDAYYLDSTKNASRRFCSLACQNRAKSAAYRQKRREQPE
ncbi:CGNR zinc finger domain-containing protein [Dactylosporangium sp. NPDC000244]|uniref:CGNR zinc finger domain-containing protein n=1 Tax=Dactylosporangium sp. NPDC000244 TaxID=3154365 RepID=UPI00332D055E